MSETPRKSDKDCKKQPFDDACATMPSTIERPQESSAPLEEFNQPQKVQKTDSISEKTLVDFGKLKESLKPTVTSQTPVKPNLAASTGKIGGPFNGVVNTVSTLIA